MIDRKQIIEEAFIDEMSKIAFGDGIEAAGTGAAGLGGYVGARKLMSSGAGDVLRNLSDAAAYGTANLGNRVGKSMEAGPRMAKHAPKVIGKADQLIKAYRKAGKVGGSALALIGASILANKMLED